MTLGKDYCHVFRSKDNCGMEKIFCHLIKQVGCWTNVFPTSKTANSNVVDDKTMGRIILVGLWVAYIFLKKNGQRWHKERGID